MIQIQRQTNSIVTDYYLDVIAEICAEGNNIYDYSHDLNDCDKDDVIIVPTSIDFLKVYFKGFRKIVYWMQGIDGEESYLKHHSRWRKLFLDWTSYFSIRKAKAVFFVSEEMRRYEGKKFKINMDKKSFIMPCFNVSKETGLFFDKEKYKKNVFVYVGSLSEWQCFSQTVDFYKQIENQHDDVELKVFTFSEEEAKKVLREKEVRHFCVSSVSPEQMTEALREAKFGFVLRDNIPVNNVATPTKLSSYLSAGVIPIYSTSLIDFHEKTQGMTYCVPVEDYSKVPQKLEVFMKNDIDYDLLCKEYSMLFETYYSPDYYTSLYKDRLCGLL